MEVASKKSKLRKNVFNRPRYFSDLTSSSDDDDLITSMFRGGRLMDKIVPSKRSPEPTTSDISVIDITQTTPCLNRQRRRSSKSLVSSIVELDDSDNSIDVNSLDESVQFVGIELPPTKASKRSNRVLKKTSRSSSARRASDLLSATKNVIKKRSNGKKALKMEVDKKTPLPESSPKQPTIECPICFESGGKAMSATFCGHIFCTDCLKASLKTKKRCPKCRSPLTLRKIHPIFI